MTRVQEKARPDMLGAPVGAPIDGHGLAAPPAAGAEPVVTQRPKLRRINLLPGEVAKERKQQQARIYVAMGMLLLVVLLGFLYFMKASEVSKAKDELAAARADNQTIRQQIEDPKLQAVVQKKAEYESRVEALAASVGGELSMPRIMYQLMLMMPEKAWYTQLTVTGGAEGSSAAAPGAAPTQPAGGTGAAPAAATGGQVQVTAKGGCGQITTQQWIDEITKLPIIQDAWPSNSTKQEGVTVDNCEKSQIVDITATAILTDKAGTVRAAKLQGGELP